MEKDNASLNGFRKQKPSGTIFRMVQPEGFLYNENGGSMVRSVPGE
jgi:hypothetical protein